MLIYRCRYVQVTISFPLFPPFLQWDWMGLIESKLLHLRSRECWNTVGSLVSVMLWSNPNPVYSAARSCLISENRLLTWCRKKECKKHMSQ